MLPTYNERENIKILIPEIENLLSDNKIEGEIIVVDDSSPDGTAKLAMTLNEEYGNITVIKRRKKEGIGAALKEGYDKSNGELILSMDTDLSFDVQDILRFIDEMDKGNDLVVGSRHLHVGDYEKPNITTKIKGFVSKFGNVGVRVLSGIDIHDFSANFRIIRKSVWDSIETKETTNSLLLEMIFKTKYKGFIVAEIPTRFKDRVYGESKLNLKKEIPKFFIKLVYFTLKYRVGRKTL